MTLANTGSRARELGWGPGPRRWCVGGAQRIQRRRLDLGTRDPVDGPHVGWDWASGGAGPCWLGSCCDLDLSGSGPRLGPHGSLPGLGVAGQMGQAGGGPSLPVCSPGVPSPGPTGGCNWLRLSQKPTLASRILFPETWTASPRAPAGQHEPRGGSPGCLGAEAPTLGQCAACSPLGG